MKLGYSIRIKIKKMCLDNDWPGGNNYKTIWPITEFEGSVNICFLIRKGFYITLCTFKGFVFRDRVQEVICHIVLEPLN